MSSSVASIPRQHRCRSAAGWARVVLFWLSCWFCLSFGRTASAEPDSDPIRVSVVFLTPAPAGVDTNRLVEKARLYLADMRKQIQLDTSGMGAASDYDFSFQLSWVGEGLTPARGVLFDNATVPPHEDAFIVEQALDVETFERLLALKLRSALRAALDRREEAQQVEPVQPEPEFDRHPTATKQQSRTAALELGALLGTEVATRNPTTENKKLGPHFGLRLGLNFGAFEPGLSGTLALPHSGTSDAEIFEGSATLSLRSWLVRAELWALAIELDGGILVADVSAERGGERRSTSPVSPIVTGGVLARYRLSAHVAIIGGPVGTFLPSRRRVYAAGEPIYDAGRLRLGLEAALRMEF